MVQVISGKKRTLGATSDLYTGLRIELLESIRDEIEASRWDCRETSTVHYWLNVAIKSAILRKPDWLVEYQLRCAAKMLKGRHQAKVLCEIQFAILEFRPMRLAEVCGQKVRRH